MIRFKALMRYQAVSDTISGSDDATGCHPLEASCMLHYPSRLLPVIC